MRVLHIIPSIAPVRGGPSQAILEMVKALRQSDLDTEIATTNDNGSELLDVPLQQRVDYQKVPVWFFPRFSPVISSVAEFAFSSQFTSWLWQNISSYDLIHIHAIFSYPSTMAMKIARLKGIPYIIRPLGQLCQWSLQQAQLKKQIYLRIIERANLQGSSALHLTAKQEQQEMASLRLKTNSFILPHGLVIPDRISEARAKLRAKLKLAANDKIVLFLSRIHQKKGLDYLIPALNKINDKSVTFVLAGNADSAYEAEVDKMLLQHNLFSRTIKTGFVKGEDKNLLLQGSDIFALTSYSENFGVAVLEALAVGTPVLTTPGVALSSLLEQENIGYVTELNVNKIASNLEYILSHPQEAEEKSDRASKFVEANYTWKNIAVKMISVYEKILERRGHSSKYT
ncbi:MAG: glycosyltransferase [Cyanobacteria bacterium J06600_6]